MIKRYDLLNGLLVESLNEDSVLDIYEEPTKEELDYVKNIYKIDQHNLYSALDPDEIGRVECDDEFKFILLKRPKNYSSIENLHFKVTTLGIFIDKDKIIIIMPESIQILEAKHGLKLRGVNDILLKLIYGTIFHFLGHLKVIGMILDNLEQEIANSSKPTDLVRMYTLQKSIVYYQNGIESNKVVIEKLRQLSKKFSFDENNHDFLDDIFIENDQCKLLNETYGKIVNIMIRSKDAFVNSHLNNVMKRLTLITTIFMPLTLLSGIGGMSEWSMIMGSDNWWWSYPLCIGIMITIGVITFKIFKWNGWTK